LNDAIGQRVQFFFADVINILKQKRRGSSGGWDRGVLPMRLD